MSVIEQKATLCSGDRVVVERVAMDAPPGGPHDSRSGTSNREKTYLRARITAEPPIRPDRGNFYVGCIGIVCKNQVTVFIYLEFHITL